MVSSGSTNSVEDPSQECDILEIGCGDGTLWKDKRSVKLPEDIHIVLSDISEGMLRDARRAVGAEDTEI
ncbi:MAG: class I SAM-dependent methyltransferase [[Clostridium] scindens]